MNKGNNNAHDPKRGDFGKLLLEIGKYRKVLVNQAERIEGLEAVFFRLSEVVKQNDAHIGILYQVLDQIAVAINGAFGKEVLDMDAMQKQVFKALDDKLAKEKEEAITAAAARREELEKSGDQPIPGDSKLFEYKKDEVN